mmetsp:Transcript_11094/g.25722  ORF Transcript_11094/g.25722 Transcript_11094/m.25722 type:complete len:137 (-) Transcript_11094:101-511(-)
MQMNRCDDRQYQGTQPFCQALLCLEKVGTINVRSRVLHFFSTARGKASGRNMETHSSWTEREKREFLVAQSSTYRYLWGVTLPLFGKFLLHGEQGAGQRGLEMINDIHTHIIIIKSFSSSCRLAVGSQWSCLRTQK